MTDPISSDYSLGAEAYDLDREYYDGKVGSKVDSRYEVNPFTPLTIQRIASVALLGISVIFIIATLDMFFLSSIGGITGILSLVTLVKSLKKIDYDNPSVRKREIDKIRNMNLSDIIDKYTLANTINYDLLLANRVVYRHFDQLGHEYLTSKNNFLFEKNKLNVEYNQKVAPLKANVNMIQNDQNRIWDRKEDKRKRDEDDSQILENISLGLNTYSLYNAKNDLRQAEDHYGLEKNKKLRPLKEQFHRTTSRINAQFERIRRGY